jgi:hypothetical protein
MPPAAVTCPGCQTKLKVTDQMLGKTIQCPKCQKTLKLGGTPAPTNPTPAATPGSNKQPTVPVKKPDSQPVKKPAAMPSMDLGEDEKKPAPRNPVKPQEQKQKQQQKTAPKEEEEVLDESALEAVDEVEEVEDVVEPVDEEPEPAPKKGKKRRDDDEDDEDEDDDRGGHGGRGKHLNTEEYGDPLIGLGLSKDQIKDVKSELGKGERVVWAGTRSDRINERNAKIASIVGWFFLLIGIAVLVVSFVLDIPTGVRIGLIVFGIIWSLISVLAICAPLFIAMGKKRRESGAKQHVYDIYVLTNKRCLCWMSRFPGRVYAYNALHVQDLKRKDNGGVPGAGSIVFATKTEVNTMGGGRGGASLEHIDLGFIDIDDVREVEKLIRQTLLRERA